MTIRTSRPSELRSCMKSRWPSWAPVPNKPTVSVDVKQHSTNQSGDGHSTFTQLCEVRVQVSAALPWTYVYNYRSMALRLHRPCALLLMLGTDEVRLRQRPFEKPGVNMRSMERQSRGRYGACASSGGVQAVKPTHGLPQVVTARDCRASCGLDFHCKRVFVRETSI